MNGRLNTLPILLVKKLGNSIPLWIPIVTFLLFCFCPGKTYPILVITAPKLSPLADYALFEIASERAIGLTDGDFRKVFNRSRAESRRVVIESSPVGEAIVRLMENTDLVWKGTASELLKELENYTQLLIDRDTSLRRITALTVN